MNMTNIFTCAARSKSIQYLPTYLSYDVPVTVVLLTPVIFYANNEKSLSLGKTLQYASSIFAGFISAAFAETKIYDHICEDDVSSKLFRRCKELALMIPKSLGIIDSENEHPICRETKLVIQNLFNWLPSYEEPHLYISHFTVHTAITALALKRTGDLSAKNLAIFNLAVNTLHYIATSIGTKIYDATCGDTTFWDTQTHFKEFALGIPKLLGLIHTANENQAPYQSLDCRKSD